MNHYPRHVGDYLKKTLGLSLAQDGAYGRALDWYYSHERPLPAKPDVYDELRCRDKRERDAVDVVLAKYFLKTDDGYRHERCDEELARYQTRAESARTNGRNGGRPNNRTETESVISGIPEPNRTRTESKTSHNQNQNQNQEPQTLASGGHPPPVAAREQQPATKAGPRTIGEPTADHRALANDLGVPCDAEFARYRDWLTTSGKRHRNESAGFANWLRRAADFKARDAPKVTANDRRADVADQMFRRGKYAVASSAERDISGVAERLD